MQRGKRAPVKRSLVRTIVEHLQELAPSEMEHKLWIDTEFVCQPEAAGVLLPILGKLLAKPDQHPVQPPQHVRRVVNLRLKHGDARHEDGGGLLIEKHPNRWGARLGKVACDRRDAESHLS